jgi:hypothetical protein
MLIAIKLELESLEEEKKNIGDDDKLKKNVTKSSTRKICMEIILYIILIIAAWVDIIRF